LLRLFLAAPLAVGGLLHAFFIYHEGEEELKTRNKTAVATALFLLMASSAAHASITLYGILDTGVGYDMNKGNSSYSRDRTDATEFKTSRLGPNSGVHFGSRWGIRGTEDLGNGLQAKFVLESGFDVPTGQSIQGGRLFGRQATLGLAGEDWGQVDFGLKNNMPTEYFSMAHPLGGGGGIVGFGSTFSVANTVRYDNQIQYQSPTLNGFQFGIGYSFNINGKQHWDSERPDGTNSKDSNIRAVTTGLRYNNGPLSAALVYDQLHINKQSASGARPAADSTRVSAWAYIGGRCNHDPFIAQCLGLLSKSDYFGGCVAGTARQQRQLAAHGVGTGAKQFYPFLVGQAGPFTGGAAYKQTVHALGMQPFQHAVQCRYIQLSCFIKRGDDGRDIALPVHPVFLAHVCHLYGLKKRGGLWLRADVPWLRSRPACLAAPDWRLPARCWQPVRPPRKTR
jgi:predicted porin